MKFVLVAPLLLTLAFSASAQEPTKAQLKKELEEAVGRAEKAEAALKEKAEAERKAAELAAEEKAAKSKLNAQFIGTFGNRTTFGEKTGNRVNEFLTKIGADIFTKGENGCPELRVHVDGTWGISGNADSITPGQTSAEHCELNAAFTAFTYRNSHDTVEGWEVRYERISASPLGLEERDSVNIFPYVIETFDRGNWGRFAMGARYESQSYDSAFLRNIGNSADPTEYNVGLYCEAEGRIYSQGEGKGIFFGPGGHVFLSELDRMERWNAHFSVGTPLLPESFGVKNCHIALEAGYTDDHGEIGRSRYLAITGVIPF